MLHQGRIAVKDETQTILVVDDEPPIQLLLRNILEGGGYRVIVKGNGREALEALSDNDGISLVLLDVTMPVMDGWQTLDLIREKSDVPVIMVTGLGAVTSVSSALQLGADDYITKPFRPRELLARVKAKLKRAGSG